MKRSVRLKWSNLQVGALITVVIAVALWASFSGGGTSIFERKQKFVCYFRNVDGLVRGSPVWMAGMEVGNVRSLEFANLDSLRRVRVVCAVKTSIWPQLTSKSEVLLGSIGFLGDKYIEIIPGDVGGVPIAPMTIIRTRDAGDVKAVFKEAEQAAATAGSVLANIDTLLDRMNRGEGTLGKIATRDDLYIQMTKLAANLTKLTADLQRNQERVVSSMERLSLSVENVSDRVNENTGTLGRIMNDPALYDNLSATSARLDTIMMRINSADGSLGLLVQDTALYTEIVELLDRVSNLVSDIEKNPRKYFKFSVF
ncbi:MAG TPA: MlaD family protein [Acidobacteriota bacterium]|nr:MlaD family protein [Acidobacteriota bacterium]